MTPKQAKATGQPSQTGVAFKVRVQPKASRNRVEGYLGDTLRLRVTAPPESGKANLAVISLLAETLGVPKSRVQILRGHASRDKLVLVESMTIEEVDCRLRGLAG